MSQKCIKKKNWQVTSLSTKKPRSERKISKVKYIICDISSKKEINKKLSKSNFDYVINLGGYVDHSHKKKVYNSHYLGCKNLADFFIRKNIRSFVQMSTGLEYGNSLKLHKENIKCKPRSIYALSKYKATLYLLNLYQKKKFPVTILRLYQAYGPNQDYNRLIPYLIINSLKNKKFDCTDGRQIRDFIYIEDLTELILKVFENTKTKGQILNIGSGYPIKIKDIINKIVLICRKGKPIFGGIKMRKDESLKMCPDIKKIKKILNFKNKHSIGAGLKKTISYYVK